MKNPIFTFLPLLLIGPVAAQDSPSNDELSRRIDALSEKIADSDLIEAGGELTSYQGMGPAASKIYTAGKGVSLGGYGELLYTSAGDNDSGATWDLYRVITYLGYRFDDNWLFNSEIEIEHMDEVYVEFAYLDYHNGDNMGLRFGHLLTPMGWINELHEPTTFWSANRPGIEKNILPSTWHENGVGAYGDAGDLEWRAYIMGGFDAAGFDLDSSGVRGGRQKGSKAKSDNLAYVGRVDWKGVKGLTLGGSYYVGDSAQGTDSEGDYGFATTIWEAHAQYDNGPLRIRGLMAKAEVEDWEQLSTAATDGEASGHYVEIGYDLMAGEKASFTPFYRMESYNLADAEDAASDVSNDVYGVAYQPNAGTIFKLDYLPESGKMEFGIGWTF